MSGRMDSDIITCGVVAEHVYPTVISIMILATLIFYNLRWDPDIRHTWRVVLAADILFITWHAIRTHDILDILLLVAIGLVMVLGKVRR